MVRGFFFLRVFLSLFSKHDHLFIRRRGVARRAAQDVLEILSYLFREMSVLQCALQETRGRPHPPRGKSDVAEAGPAETVPLDLALQHHFNAVAGQLLPGHPSLRAEVAEDLFEPQRRVAPCCGGALVSLGQTSHRSNQPVAQISAALIRRVRAARPGALCPRLEFGGRGWLVSQRPTAGAWASFLFFLFLITILIAALVAARLVSFGPSVRTWSSIGAACPRLSD